MDKRICGILGDLSGNSPAKVIFDPAGGKKLVDESDYIWFFWNGESNETAELIRYAERTGKKYEICFL